MSTILLNNVKLVDGRRVNILIKDKLIASVDECTSGAVPEGIQADRVIDCRDFCAIPGLFNMHTHSAMTLVRGVGKGQPLQAWLDEIWGIEAHLDAESVYWGTKLAILEMIRNGITCFNDMYWFLPEAHRAAEEMGTRAVLNYVLLDSGSPEKADIQRRECAEMYAKSKDWSDRMTFGVAVHADYTVCEENMAWAGNFTKEHDLPLHVHLSETKTEVDDDYAKFGMSPVRHFDNMGLIGRNFIAAHTLWLNDEDIEILGSRGATVVHNINSNLILSSGYKFKYNELRDAGANVCIGTDGCGSSDNLDIRESMKTMLMLQHAWRNDPQAMPLDELFNVATVNGARAAGINAGTIEAGKLADIALVDMRRPELIPDFNFLSNFIFSANSSCIDTVICDGRIIMEGRKVAGEDEIMAKADEQAWKLMRKTKAQ